MSLIRAIDHIVLTVSDIDAAAAFYARVLQMERRDFADTRTALHFGRQKINLQTLGQEPRNKARVGAGDLCLLTEWRPEDVVGHLAREGVRILEGPVQKAGACGAMTSVYFNDPDGNLVEVSSYERHGP